MCATSVLKTGNCFSDTLTATEQTTQYECDKTCTVPFLRQFFLNTGVEHFAERSDGGIWTVLNFEKCVKHF